MDELKTLEKMITLYCRKHHGTKQELCTECSTLLDYAFDRLEKCPLKPNKPVCSQCKIHCYKPEKREHIRKVMRFSGPRMMYKNPLGALGHLLRKIRRQARQYGG
ncbi:MAG: nitrous oxide-stimulated promoter family protein [Spirochaetia bacterium]